jgi:hypothetical protein
MTGLRVQSLSLFSMREFYQPEGHIWQPRSIRISIGRRQRRVRERGLPDPLPDPKSSGTKKG